MDQKTIKQMQHHATIDRQALGQSVLLECMYTNINTLPNKVMSVLCLSGVDAAYAETRAGRQVQQ